MSMPQLVNNAASLTIAKKTGTVLTLLTNQKYVDANQQFTIGVQDGASAANTASADVSVDSTAATSGGTNISAAVGSKTTTEPSSGFFIRMNASGSGSSKVTTAGWLDEGNLAVASTQETKYFPIAAGDVTQNAPTINASTGVVTASVSTTAGYIPTIAVADSNTLQLSTQDAVTVTPTRSEQTIVTAGKYTLGAVKVSAIPSSYYTLDELFPVGSLYANATGTNPSITLGYGTWTLIRNTPYRWGDVSANTWDEMKDDTWSFEDKIADTVYVYRRTA